MTTEPKPSRFMHAVKRVSGGEHPPGELLDEAEVMNFVTCAERVFGAEGYPRTCPVDSASLLLEHLAGMINGRRLLSPRGAMRPVALRLTRTL